MGGVDAAHPFFDALREALGFAKGAFPALALSGNLAEKRRLVLPTVFGTWKESLMAPGTQAAADLDAMGGGEVCVVRFADVQRAIEGSGAHLGRHAAERFGVRGVAVREIEVEFGHYARRAGVFEAAAALDAQPELAAAIGEQVARHVTRGSTAIVLFEPVMGLARAGAVMADVERAAGVRCAEMLSSVPSVPGRRWQDAIDAALKKAGVTVEKGEATAYEAAGRAVAAVKTDAGHTVRGSAFILATGRFVGGGIRRDAAFSETLFGLPVSCAGTPGSNPSIHDTTGRRISDRHAAFSAGVRTDDAMRPLGADDAPAFDNLYAAGAVIGDRGVVRGPSGMGLAILSGYLAGVNAVKAG